MKKAVVTQIDGETWRFTEQLLGVDVYCYLLVGKEKALLIDTAYGLTDIPAAVRERTDKPLIVVNTHGHFDHISGNYQYDEVLLSPLDEEVYARHSRQEYIEELFLGSVGPLRGKAVLLAMRPTLRQIYSHPFPATSPLPDIIDLGGRNIQIIPTPGHTQGSVSLLDTKHGWLFSGDTCCDEGVLLHFPEGTTVQVFHESIRRICSLVKEGTVVRNYTSHQTTPAPLEKLAVYEQLLSRLESGDLSEDEWKKGKIVLEGVTVQFDPCRVKTEIGGIQK